MVVGDPEGRTAYVNPAFAARFRPGGGDATGQPLSALFEGGVREAVLRAVVECCEQGRTVRFRLRHAGVGYTAVASPIVAEDARVGVVILLVESGAADERLLALQREIAEPVGELRRVLDELLEQTGGRRDERYRTLVEEGSRALARVQKWSDELTALIAGRPAAARPDASFDAVRVVQDAAARHAGRVRRAGHRARSAGSGAPAAGARRRRARRARARPAAPGAPVDGAGIGVRHARRPPGRPRRRPLDRDLDLRCAGGRRPRSMADPTEPLPAIVTEIVRELGGEIRSAADPLVGRTTAIRLDVRRVLVNFARLRLAARGLRPLAGLAALAGRSVAAASLVIVPPAPVRCGADTLPRRRSPAWRRPAPSSASVSPTAAGSTRP